MYLSVMNQDDEYRRQAAEAQHWAEKTISDVDKAAWLRIAQGWLALIRRPNQSASDKFDKQEQTDGTHQKKSDAEH
jgi:hypothetical protein